MTLEAGGEILGVQGTCVSNLFIVCQQSKQLRITVCIRWVQMERKCSLQN